MLLVYALIEAPESAGARRDDPRARGRGPLLSAFVVNELRARNPLLPFSIFRVKGLVAADATRLVALAGFSAMFFFVTLYMQEVLASRRSRRASPTSRYRPFAISAGVGPSCSRGSGPGP